jgi:transposase
MNGGISMAYQVEHVNKKTGVKYIYESTSNWDKTKKQSRNKQVCIGKIDTATGKFIPSRRLNPAQAAVRDPSVTATSEIIGPSMILDRITSDLGLDKLLRSCFPQDYKQILCMAYFIVIRGGALCHCEAWSKGHSHAYGKPLTSQRISEILQEMKENDRQTFFSSWAKKILEHEYLCYDITSISSYSELNEYVKFGHNRDGEKLRQVNLAVLFGQESRLPVYYHRLPGSINDVSTLHNFLQTSKCLGMPKLHLVMDKGFYSIRNINDLFDAKDKFTIAIPNRYKWVQDEIDEARDEMYGPVGYRKVDGEVIYTQAVTRTWGKENHRCYLHLYFNAHAAADDFDGFTSELIDYKEELETGNIVKDHEDAYKSFFIVKETPVRGRSVSYNNKAIQEFRNKYAGFYCIFSNTIKDPVECLLVYRDKDSVEKCFDDLKNQLDMKRLRIHTSGAMDGRFFIQFLSVIYVSALRQEMRKAGLIDKYTVRELLGEMETIAKIKYSGKYGHIITNITKQQRLILDTLKINLPA